MNKEKFISVITPMLESFRPHIQNRLRLAYKSKTIPRDFYSADDIIDEVLIRAYEKYREQPKNLRIKKWLYLLLDKVLREKLKEENYKHRNLLSLEQLRDKEMKSLELEEVEQIAATADGQPVLMEDLDSLY